MQKDAKNLINYRNPGTWVLIWEYSARAFKWIPTWQGLDVFQKSLWTELWKKVASAPQGLNVIMMLLVCWYYCQYLHLRCIQYRHSIPAPIDQMSASAWWYTHLWLTCQKVSQAQPTLLANQSYIRLWGHPFPGNWVSIRHAVMYYAQAAHAFSAGIKCRHCRWNKDTTCIDTTLIFQSKLLMECHHIRKTTYPWRWRPVPKLPYRNTTFPVLKYSNCYDRRLPVFRDHLLIIRSVVSLGSFDCTLFLCAAKTACVNVCPLHDCLQCIPVYSDTTINLHELNKVTALFITT